MSEVGGPEVRAFTQSLHEGEVFGVPFVAMYDVEAYLNTSSVAELYVARNRVENEQAALKVFHQETDSAAIDEEIDLLDELQDDPCFPKLLDYGEAKLANGEVRRFLVMELLSGKSLQEGVDELPSGLEVKRIVDKVYHALEGLENLHDIGYVHRDIKPEHIIGEGRLCDVGLASKPQEHCQGAPGTIGYKAPEVYDGEVDPKNDVFSISVTLYERTTMKRPFTVPPAPPVPYRGIEIEREEAYVRSLENDQPKPPHEINPAVPPALSYIIMRGMARDPEERLSTPELRSELAHLLRVAA